MNKDIFLNAIFIAFITIFSNSLFAGTIEVYADDWVNGVSDVSSATSGTIGASVTDSNGSLTNWSGSATATATGTSTGFTAVSVEGLYACCDFDLSAETFYTTSYTNSTAFATDFTYNFLINGPAVELFGSSLGLGAQAKANVYMYTDSGVTDEVTLFLELANYGNGLELLSSGGAVTEFSTGGLGYQMDNLMASFSGVLAAGETVTFNSKMYAAIFGPGYEDGAKAFIGDPNSLSTTPGFSDEFLVASVSPVPLPASAWFFATGLLGLFGVSKRRKV